MISEVPRRTSDDIRGGHRRRLDKQVETPLQVLNRDAAGDEIVSLSAAAQECVFLRKLCIEMGFHQHSPTILYEDCEVAVALSKETNRGAESTNSGLRPASRTRWSSLPRKISAHWCTMMRLMAPGRANLQTRRARGF